MIYRLRKKFIKICTLSFVAVFLLLLGAIFTITCLQTNAHLDRLADVISENDGAFPPFNESDPNYQKPPPFGAEALDRESPFITRFFTVRFGGNGELLSLDTRSIASVTDRDAAAYGRKVLERGKERGWTESFRFKLYKTERGSSVVFINGGAAQRSSQSLLITSAAVFAAGSVVVLLLIILISKWAVKPTAESYEKQKQFITDVNHELKTPLTLIRTNLEIAGSELGQNEWLDDIRVESEKMTELVGRLVTLARMDEEGARPEMLPFNLSEAVSDTVNAFAATVLERGKSLDARISPLVNYQGDEAAIRQLISILMDNAVKYCDPGGKISVSLQSHGGRHPVLTVDNTYMAVKATELSSLFDRFYRGDRARTYGEGFGIGLSIAKSIVEKHHGSIQARSAGNDMIRFMVRL